MQKNKKYLKYNTINYDIWGIKQIFIQTPFFYNLIIIDL